MTLEMIIEAAENAGFIVDASYPDVIISLTNRTVSILEVALALNISQSICQSSNGAVLIKL